MGFPGGSDGKESTCKVGDSGSSPGLGRFPGEGNGSPLQYPCQGNPKDNGAWRATVHEVAKSRDTTEGLTRTHMDTKAYTGVERLGLNHIHYRCMYDTDT